MIDEIEDNMSGAAQAAGAQVQNKVNELKQTAQEWQARATDSARRAMEATDTYVRDNPWMVLGSVAIACIAVGFLLARSRD